MFVLGDVAFSQKTDFCAGVATEGHPTVRSEMIDATVGAALRGRPCAESNYDRVCRSARFVTNDDLFSGSVVV